MTKNGASPTPAAIAFLPLQTTVAQFIAVCSSAKPCVIGENLLSVSDPRSHDQRRGSSMFVLEYVHQLFNADQCHASIRPLRWKDRLLHCPRCQSRGIDP